MKATVISIITFIAAWLLYQVGCTKLIHSIQGDKKPYKYPVHYTFEKDVDTLGARLVVTKIDTIPASEERNDYIEITLSPE